MTCECAPTRVLPRDAPGAEGGVHACMQLPVAKILGYRGEKLPWGGGCKAKVGLLSCKGAEWEGLCGSPEVEVRSGPLLLGSGWPWGGQRPPPPEGSLLQRALVQVLCTSKEEPCRIRPKAHLVQCPVSRSGFWEAPKQEARSPPLLSCILGYGAPPPESGGGTDSCKVPASQLHNRQNAAARGNRLIPVLALRERSLEKCAAPL